MSVFSRLFWREGAKASVSAATPDRPAKGEAETAETAVASDATDTKTDDPRGKAEPGTSAQSIPDAPLPSTRPVPPFIPIPLGALESESEKELRELDTDTPQRPMSAHAAVVPGFPDLDRPYVEAENMTTPRSGSMWPSLLGAPIDFAPRGEPKFPSDLHAVRSPRTPGNPPPLPPRHVRQPASESDRQDDSTTISGVVPIASSFDVLVDAAVDALQQPAAAGRTESAVDRLADQRAVVEMFSSIAQIHGRPLRELIFQLSVGSTPRAWAAACRPLLRPLLDAAHQIGWFALIDALVQLEEALDQASGSSDELIDEESTRSIVEAYEQLRVQLPDVFTARDTADSRRLILLESLLLQVPGMHRRTIAKLYAAGLHSIAQLSQAKPEELMAVITGLDTDVASGMVSHLQRFERQRSSVDPTSLRGHVHGRLRTALSRLAQLQEEFERAEHEGSHLRKKSVRRVRETTLRQLQRLLAELGELSLIEELKRCSTRSKIQRVQTYLQQQASA